MCPRPTSRRTPCPWRGGGCPGRARPSRRPAPARARSTRSGTSRCQVDALQVGDAQHGEQRAALAVASGAAQVEVPGGAAADEAPRLLVGGGRRHTHRLERLGVGADGADLERLAETVLEEELRWGQPATALLTLADAPVSYTH